MFINTVLSEWTKLRTTKSLWWTTGLIFFFAILWTVIIARSSGEAELGISPFSPQSLTSILLLMGLPIIMIQGIMVVTTEYRYKLQSTAFMSTSNRWSVALAKLLLYGVIAAAIMFVGVVGTYALADLTATSSASEAFTPFSDEAGKRSLWLYPLAAFLVVLFVQGLGLLLRQTAGTVAIALILYLGIENIIRLLPKFGDDIIHFMPFTAFNNWLSNVVGQDAPWDSVGMEALVFIVWAVVLWVLGVVMLEKRDA